MQDKIPVLLFVGVMLVAPLSYSLSTSTTAQPTTSTQIDSCTTITEPGQYRLTQDVQNSQQDACIRIESSNVQFDGNGHTIDGVRTVRDINRFVNAVFETGTIPDDPKWANYGIRVNGSEDTPVTNVTVQNVRVKQWYFGISYQNTAESEILNVTASQNGDGISIYQSQNFVVTDSATNNNAEGIVADNATEGRISDSQGQSNLIDGIAAYNASSLSVSGNHGSKNAETAIYVQDSTKVTLSNNTARANGDDGLIVSGGSNNTLTNNTLRANEKNGISIFTSDNNTLLNNLATGNKHGGIALAYGTENTTLVRNTVANTTGTDEFSNATGYAAGLILNNSSSNLIRETTAQNTTNWTYYATNNSTSNTVTNLSIRNETAAPITFTATDVALAPATSPPQPPTGSVSTGTYLNLTGTSSTSAIELRMHYTDADIQDVNESSLRLWQYADGEWQPIEGSTVTPEQNTVSATIEQFDTNTTPIIVTALGNTTTANATQSQPQTEQKTQTAITGT